MTMRLHPPRTLLVLLLLAAAAITNTAGAAEPQPAQAPASSLSAPSPAAGEAAPKGGAERPLSQALQARDAQLPPRSGLPAPAAPPRTLRAHWHVFIAFAIAWLLLFAFVVRLHRRFAQLDREMREVAGRGS